MKKNFQVGEVVRSRITGEEGSIVRIVGASEVIQEGNLGRMRDFAYVVLLGGDNLHPPKEVLWRQSDFARKTASHPKIRPNPARAPKLPTPLPSPS